MVPYGISAVGANTFYVRLGVDHHTAQFAVNTTRLWLNKGICSSPLSVGRHDSGPKPV